MVSAADNGYLIVHRHEFDCRKGPHQFNPCFLWICEWVRRTVAIPFLNSRIHWSSLVRAGVPENFQMLLCAVSFGIERCVHPVYYFLIRATLEGYCLALVVESEVEI
jgi:hypothetical protein